MNDRGSVSVLMLGSIALLVVLGLMLGTAGHYLSVQSRVQTAADAAALAAAPVTFHPFGSAGNPVAEAAQYAAANGGRLTRCVCSIDRSWNARVVEVEVSQEVNLIGLGRREVLARAAAEFVPVMLLTLETLD